jgi:hypothetical protein
MKPKPVDRSVRVELPEVLYRVSKAFGLETALKVADALGGTHVTIGQKVTANSALAKAAGLDVALFLKKHYGHGRLLIPLGPASAYKSRTRLLRQLIAGGESTTRIVKLVRCHTRTVEWNRQQLRKRSDKRQLLLL